MTWAARLLLVLLAFFLQNAASADSLVWLKRMTQANGSLDYNGTFIYQCGPVSETSRIVHGTEDGREMEWIQVLDGPPREMLRVGDEVRAFLPGEKREVVEKRAGGRGFPGRVAVVPEQLLNYYTVKAGDGERVAGLDAQLLILEPKDGWRFGHRFWVDANTGLLLKARVVDDKGQPVEQFSFTQIAIGSPQDFTALKARWREDRPQPDWKVDNMLPGEAVNGDAGWNLHGGVPGFRKTAAWRRRLGDGAGSVLHMLFSDGVAAVSVFVTPADQARTARPGTSTQGGVAMHVRLVSGNVVTAMGEVPPATVRKIAESLELKK